MERVANRQVEEAIQNFKFEGTLIDTRPYGSGHINDTYLLTFEIASMGRMKVILQRMNKQIFTKPEELMENIIGVTSYLREKIIENGGDPDRETLNLIPTVGEKPYYIDSEGDYWRSYIFITDATSYDQVEKPEDFYQSAVAFGNFQRLLSDYPAGTLHETIQGFHDTKARFQTFREAVKKDVCGRAAKVQKEIEFVLAHEEVANIFSDLQEKGELPLRVTHNDTKLNNIMIDDATGQAICIIDLDTIMPGLSIFDYGDSIRFGASTAEEDEPDLDKVHFDIHLYELYVKGYMEMAKDVLTPAEMASLPWGARLMTFECGIRFLMDFLQGDIYFKTAYPEHNLVRARTQFRLVKEMEEQFDQMNEILKKYI